MYCLSSAEDIKQDLLGVGRDPVRELDVKLDDEVASPGGVLGVRQTLALDPSDSRGLHNVVFHVEGH